MAALSLGFMVGAQRKPSFVTLCARTESDNIQFPYSRWPGALLRCVSPFQRISGCLSWPGNEREQQSRSNQWPCLWGPCVWAGERGGGGWGGGAFIRWACSIKWIYILRCNGRCWILNLCHPKNKSHGLGYCPYTPSQYHLSLLSLHQINDRIVTSLWCFAGLAI